MVQPIVLLKSAYASLWWDARYAVEQVNVALLKNKQKQNDDWSNQVLPSTNDRGIVFLFFSNPRAKYFLRVQ